MEQKEYEMDFTAGNIISLSFESFKENIKFYIVLGLIVIILATIVSTLFSDDPDPEWLPIIFLMVVLIGLYTKFAVMVHRSILLQELSIKRAMFWSNNESKFMLWIIGIFVTIGATVTATIFMVSTLTTSNDPSPIFGFLAFFAIITFAILSSRLVIIFPSIAVGRKLSLSECWKLTGQYKGSMFALVIGFPYLTNIILKLIPEEGLVWIIIGSTVSVIVTIVEIIIISHAYNTLVEDSPTKCEYKL